MSYRDLMEKAEKGLKTVPGSVIILKPSEIANLSKASGDKFYHILLDILVANKVVQKLYSSDKYSVDSALSREVSKVLSMLRPRVKDFAVKETLNNKFREVLDLVVKGIGEELQKAGVKSVELPGVDKPLSIDELKEVGFEEGKLPEDRKVFNEVLRDFSKSEIYRKMEEKERNRLIERLMKMFEVSGGKEEVLTPSEVEYFKAPASEAGIGFENLNQITPSVKQSVVNTWIRHLVTSRRKAVMEMPLEAKKDLIKKLLNMVRSVKGDTVVGLSAFDEKWLSPKAIEDFAERAVRPGTRFDVFQDEEGKVRTLGEEERAELREKDKKDQGIKPTDTGRAVELIDRALDRVVEFKEGLRRVNFSDEMDRLAREIRGALPEVADVENGLEAINAYLGRLDISKADVGKILNVEEGQLNPRINKQSLLDLKSELLHVNDDLKIEMDPEARAEKYKNKIEGLKQTLAEESKSTQADEQALNKIKAQITTLEALERKGANNPEIVNKLVDRQNLLLKRAKADMAIYSQGLDKVTEAANKYLDMLNGKKGAVNQVLKDNKRVAGILKSVTEGIALIRKSFEDISRLDVVRMGWNRSEAILPSEKQKAEDFNKDPIKSDIGEEIFEKQAAGKTPIERYQEKMQDFAANTAELIALKNGILKEVNIIAAKYLSIREAKPGNTHAKALGMDRDFTHNPLGGKGPSINEISKSLEEKLKKLGSIDLDSLVKKAMNLIEGLTDLPKLVTYTGREKSASGGEVAELKDVGTKEEILKRFHDYFKDDEESRERDELADIAEKKEKEKKKSEIPDPEYDAWKKTQKTKYYQKSEPTTEGVKPSRTRGLGEEKKYAPSNLTTMYDRWLSKKRESKTGPRALPNFFVQDSSRIVDKFVKYMETAGIPDMILNPSDREGPSVDVKTKVDEAIKKIMDMPGSINSYLDNDARRQFENDRAIAKARQDLPEIEKSMRKISDDLESIKDKYMDPIEKLLDMIEDPIGKLEQAVSGEKVELSKGVTNLSDLIGWAQNTRVESGYSLMDLIANSEFLSEYARNKLTNAKEFLIKSNQLIKNAVAGKLSPEDAVQFLKDYNFKLNTDYKDIPTIDQMKEDLRKIKSIVELTPEKKEFLEELSRLTKKQYKEMPKASELKEIYQRVVGEEFDINAFTRSHEELVKEYERIMSSKDRKIKYLNILSKIPKSLMQEIKKTPGDVTEREWYRDIQKDKSHHKTRWVEKAVGKGIEERAKAEAERMMQEKETILKSIKDKGTPWVKDFFSRYEETLEDYKKLDNERRLYKLVGNIGSLKKDVQEIARDLDFAGGKTRKIRPAKVTESTKLVMDNQNSGEVINSIKESQRDIVGVLKEIEQADAKVREVRALVYASVEEYHKLKAVLAEVSRAKPETTEESKNQKQRISELSLELNKLQATISFLNKKLEKEYLEFLKIQGETQEQLQGWVTTLEGLLKAGKLPKDQSSLVKALIATMKGQMEQAEGTEKEAGKDDPYSEPMSEFDVALEKTPAKDLPRANKTDLLKQLDKTMEFFKNVDVKLKAGKRVKDLNIAGLEEFFNKATKNLPEFMDKIRTEFIPTIKSLIKQNVVVKSTIPLVTSVENAAEKIEELMDLYTSERTKMINRYNDLERQHSETMRVLGDMLDYIDPETGKFLGFTDEEKDLLRRVFLRQVWRAMDDLWAQIPHRNIPAWADRELPHYNHVWDAFKEQAGIKSNKKLVGLLRLIRAEVKSDDEGHIQGIRFKSQQLINKINDLKKKYKEMGQDPEKVTDIKELEKIISVLKEKEARVKKIFSLMINATHIGYLNDVRSELKQKAKDLPKGVAPEVLKPKEKKEVKTPSSYEVPEKTVNEIKERSINEVVDAIDAEVSNVLKDEDAAKKRIKEVDALNAKFETLFASLDELLSESPKSVKPESKSVKTEAKTAVDLAILYSPVIQRTIKAMLKKEIQIQ